MHVDDDLPGDQLPLVAVPLPGSLGARLIDDLSRVECPGLTARRRRREELSGASHDPIVWARARGANVVDVEGNRFVDFTAGFGAALLGHSHPSVVAAVQRQSTRLLHALGDVYPSEPKIALERRLAELAPWPARVILGLSGADAVEAALKTAALATKKPGVVAFVGGYHGLSYGAVGVSGYKTAFRAPFAAQLNAKVVFAPFPSVLAPSPDEAEQAVEASLAAVDAALATGEIGAVVVEPILGRGGVEPAPAGFLAALAERARLAGAVLIADEVYTGLGRTGRLFRSIAQRCVPDILVLGKALGGGLPVSACLIREELAQAWGAPDREALHTSTFLGNPLGCAAALASLDVLTRPETADQIRETGQRLESTLTEALRDHRLGVPRTTFARLLVGLTLDGGSGRALAVMRSMLERGYIVLTGGVAGNVLTLTPPMCLTEAQIDGFTHALVASLHATRVP